MPNKADYHQAVENALACWEITTTGDAKADLNKLICIEQSVAVDPAVSDSARALQKETALECLALLDLMDWATSSYEETFYQTIEAIKKKFDLPEGN